MELHKHKLFNIYIRFILVEPLKPAGSISGKLFLATNQGTRNLDCLGSNVSVSRITCLIL